ncbi:hypothetical protein Taro_053380 [Colocasia esculenta]|uniref:SBP-type domain-containing protein n=1 Tax=Colocasia esculenta TaxID=4460 RepID=A0A843XMF6_COLES|nr:hypothetical protein [Colocasia esculenta]
MEGEVGAQVASPIFLHQGLAGRFHEMPPLARKRDLPWHSANFHINQHSQKNQQPLIGSGYSNLHSSWNPKLWQWDSPAFVAKPSSDGALRLGNPTRAADVERKKNGEDDLKDLPSVKRPEEVENLTLKLGGSPYTVEEPVVRPNKRVRSGSPGNGGNYPMCQVDDCKADLSNAKDYHRRHKVCEVHSKTTKAMVAKQMQRFCQQCSRFHILSEFDEGKRSCRRRLAGHNRRRRKTQPEDPSSRLLLPANRENGGGANLDIVNLLAILARLQGHGMDKTNISASLPDKDRLSHILSKINSLPSVNLSAKLPQPGGFDLNVSQTPEDCSEQLPKTDGELSAPSNVDLLTVLSAAVKASGTNMVAALSQGSSDGSADDKMKVNRQEPAADVNSQTKLPTFSPISVGRISCAPRSSDISENPVAQARPSLPLQLFSSTEGDSPPKTGSSGKYLSSESSNPMEDRSPSSSPPVVHRLFPLQSGTEPLKHANASICREDNGMVEESTSRGWISPLELFKDSERRVGNGTILNLPYQAGYTSSSGSDHSPSSSQSDAQDRTGRIIFKLFGKDPSSFPAALRTKILTWLSNSPSDMESYIRPGCVVLSIYLSMPAFAWDEDVPSIYSFKKTFFGESTYSFKTTIQISGEMEDSWFIQIDNWHLTKMIRLCKCWRTWSAPELISVSPLAVVSGKETSLVLRGRNLTVPGTKIHCTYMGGYSSKEVLGSTYPGTIYDDSSIESFNFPGGTPNVFGRCFIEVENGFKGNSFPIIIADDAICEELKLLESEVEVDLRTDMMHEDQAQDCMQPRSREDALHFLNELGWLFQRQSTSYPLLSNFSKARFKFLFTFSVERDLSTLVKKLVDIMVERCSENSGLIQESLETLSEIQLLHRAVKRKCQKMVSLLLHYSISCGTEASKVYLFPPDLKGPGGVSPLHLAASMKDSEEMVDQLTNDPQEIALNCWTSLVDDNGQSPHAYALMRNNISYNILVSRKLADRRNGQVSIAIDDEEVALDKAWTSTVDKPELQPREAVSCSRCAILETRRVRTTLRPKGLLQRPYVHSMLAIAAVCVCVCLFFRGEPELGNVAPFKWENLGFGAM